MKGYPNYVHINDSELNFNEYENNKNIEITIRNIDLNTKISKTLAQRRI
jgi:hypothetical protein